MNVKQKVSANNLPVNSTKSVKIGHGQTIRQSLNYQSAECSYYVEITCDDTPTAIQLAVKKVERQVEEAMSYKVVQQRKFLAKLTEN